MRFEAICIYTNNAPRLAAFYEKLLREKPNVEGSHYGFSKIAVYDPGGVNVVKDKNMSIMLSAGDLQAEYERLLNEIPDIAITSPPQRRPWGAYSFWFTDPDGNMVSIFEYNHG